jgi:hypothetical protein
MVPLLDISENAIRGSGTDADPFPLLKLMLLLVCWLMWLVEPRLDEPDAPGWR